MIKLIAIDLDGTLLNSQKEISPRNIRVLKEAKAQGVKVVICTGRPLASISAFVQTLGLSEEEDYSITFNGGLVQKNDTGSILKEYTLSAANIHDTYKIVRKLALPLDVVSGQNVFHVTPQPAGYPSIYEQLNPLMTFSAREINDFDVNERCNKMVIAVEADYLDQQISRIPQQLLEQFTFVKSRVCLLEILHKEVSKATGIAILAKELGIKKEEVMALGDEENDLSMIEYAGIGVAMGNATQQIKDAATVITGTNDEDGVAQAVAQYVLKS